MKATAEQRAWQAATILGCMLTLAGCQEKPATPAATAGKPPAPSTTAAAAPAGVKDSVAAPNTLTPAEAANGCLLLFDGESLFGWQPASKANWKVAGGTITASEGEAGLLCTTSQFADYQLKVDFRAPAGVNSGVFLRTTETPTLDDVKTKVYELNIADPSNPFPTGSFVGRQKGESVAPTSDWQTFDITAVGPKFTVLLGGRKVLEYTDPQPRLAGKIGLQFNTGTIEFRNIKLKPLGLKAMFNGKNLDGWKISGASQGGVGPAGELTLTNGKGNAEFVGGAKVGDGLYGNFIMQLDVFVHSPGLNSGVFFRSIPGEMMNGYESQINNVFKDNDRSKPGDCGTGGIFRRVDARRVVANDQEWFTKTIVAYGNHVGVWVNGYPVTDWTDTRAADLNPRKGSRVEPGTIQLQGHDPTTNLSFRKLLIAELPKE